MAEDEWPDVRSMVLHALLRKIGEDRYPSVTMLDMVEQLLRPHEVPQYIAILLRQIDQETYPSIPMLRRLMALAD